MNFIKKTLTILSLFGLVPSNLLGYSIVVTVYQKSSEIIEFSATNQKGYITRDLEPRIMKRYVIEGDSDDIDEFSFRVKGINKVRTLDLNTLLEFGNRPFIKIGRHFKFLNDNVVYQFYQDYTWENSLHHDDTLYFTIEFLNIQDYAKILADENLPTTTDYCAMLDNIWSYLETFWAIVRNDL